MRRRTKKIVVSKNKIQTLSVSKERIHYVNEWRHEMTSYSEGARHWRGRDAYGHQWSFLRDIASIFHVLFLAKRYKVLKKPTYLEKGRWEDSVSTFFSSEEDRNEFFSTLLYKAIGLTGFKIIFLIVMIRGKLYSCRYQSKITWHLALWKKK